ncbi:TetR/AcrR family transcriptional regulator [Corynebacterium sp. H78]|uniref:TetR/AcrR family transcriptional regulator n=1 Tax=Corynebacterium sp. H78 TaxID=3133417 RepID=UPI0030A918CE
MAEPIEGNSGHWPSQQLGAATPFLRERRAHSPRVQQILDEARLMLRESGWHNVSMRRLAARLDVKAPSLYKHISGKEELCELLLEETLCALGRSVNEAAESEPTPQSVLMAYRKSAFADPYGYRLISRSQFVNINQPSELDSWIREPFQKVAGGEAEGLALWAFAHGMVTAELIQDKHPTSGQNHRDSINADQVWEAGARVFS